MCKTLDMTIDCSRCDPSSTSETQSRTFQIQTGRRRAKIMHTQSTVFQALQVRDAPFVHKRGHHTDTREDHLAAIAKMIKRFNVHMMGTSGCYNVVCTLQNRNACFTLGSFFSGVLFISDPSAGDAKKDIAKRGATTHRIQIR